MSRLDNSTIVKLKDGVALLEEGLIERKRVLEYVQRTLELLTTNDNENVRLQYEKSSHELRYKRMKTRMEKEVKWTNFRRVNKQMTLASNHLRYEMR